MSNKPAGSVAAALTLAVNPNLPMPLYHQIYLILRDKISGRLLKPNEAIPAERELMQEFGVSRITVKRALNELAAEGFVARSRGRSTRVSANPPLPMTVRADVADLRAAFQKLFEQTQGKVLDFGYVPAHVDVATALSCAAGATVQRSVRHRSSGGIPVSYYVTYVPENLGRSYTKRDLATQPLLVLLERCGVEVGSAEQIITAALADTVLAGALEIAVGLPLLRIDRTVLDVARRPIEYTVSYCRPDRFQYRVKMDRQDHVARDTRRRGKGV